MRSLSPPRFGEGPGEGWLEEPNPPTPFPKREGGENQWLAPLRYLHPQVHAALLELPFRFLQRRLAEVADLQQLVVAADHQVADGGDALRLQAVRRPDRQLQLGQAHVELALEFVV